MTRKLTRFLLMFNPPGIGVEYRESDTGEIVVDHKDFPDRSVISGVKDIYPLVDKLIAGDENLTARRHRPALVQLVKRLYQLEDMDEGDIEDEAGNSPNSRERHQDDTGFAHDCEDPGGPWQEGATVVLIGLQGKFAVHNGETGVISKAKREKAKYEVSIKGEVVKLKGTDNFCLFQNVALAVNTAVVIRGLRNHTELNGCLGRVVECHTETHRFEVRATESAQLFRVKQENLVPIDGNYLPASVMKAAAPQAELMSGGDNGTGGEDDEFLEAGSTVRLQGLKTAMAYNGQTAEVLSVDRARHRYEIRLADGSVKTIRSENVRLVSRAPKTSARKKENIAGAKAADRGK